MKGISGQKFACLLAIKFIKYNKSHKQIWLFKCDCGNTKEMILSHVKRGGAKSCGCLQKETVRQAKIKHGYTSFPNGFGKLKFNKTISHIFDRCYNPNNAQYKNYGGRGIRVSNEFKNDPFMFHEYIAGLPNAGEKGLTLDRRDNNGDYERGNLRWTTTNKQINNRRNSLTISYNNKTQSLQYWANDIGIKYKTLYRRIYINKWSIEKALTTPVK